MALEDLAGGLVEQFPGCFFLLPVPSLGYFYSNPDYSLIGLKAALQKQSAVVWERGTVGVKLAQEQHSPGLPLHPFSSHHSQSR